MADYFCEKCKAHAEVSDECVHLDASAPDAYEAASFLLPFVTVCPRCGHPIAVPRPCIYTDHDRRFAVRMRPSGFRTPLYTGPLDYTLRDTQLLLEFREKVLLLTAGYDDVAVELLKARTQDANPKTRFVDIICMDIGPDYLRMEALLWDKRTLSYNSPVELYESVRKDVPDSWRPVGFATVDSSWLADRLMEDLLPDQPK